MRPLSPCHWIRGFKTIETSNNPSSPTDFALGFKMNAKQIILMSRLERTHWWYKSTHELVEACVRRFAGAGKPIFDAGCGTGGLIKTLLKLGPVSGCDKSGLSIKLARRYMQPQNKFNVQKRGIEEIHDFEAQRFDCVTCIDVLYHQEIRNWREALKNLKRLLKPGGYLILQIAAFSTLHGSHDIAVDGARRFKRSEVQAALEQFGFRIQLCSYRYSHLFPLLLPLRVASRICGSDEGPSSDFENVFRVPATVKKICGNIALSRARLENKAVMNGACMPFGSSLCLVARRA